MAVNAPVIALWVGIGSTTVAIAQGVEARKERKKSNAIERRKAEVRNRRAKKRALAERLRASAEAASAGQAAGVGGESSTIVAEQASLGSQFAANVGFASEIEQLSASELAARDRASGYVSRAQTFGAVATASTALGESFSKARTKKQAALVKRD